MDISQIHPHIFSVVVDKETFSDSQKNKGQLELEKLVESGLMTYGGLNTDCLADIFSEKQIPIDKKELCPGDDDSLDLRMPNVWYLNKGINSLSIPLYYNFLQLKEQAKDNSIFYKNSKISQNFGKVGMVELFFQNETETFLEKENMDYFGTPKTLTECMRVLEGWDTDRVPRLLHYVDYAKFIEQWCEENSENYIKSEWHLGKNESMDILKETNTTNVRTCIKEFWHEYLLQKKPKISSEDVEIDIIDSQFGSIKQPHFVLIGEDFLDLDKKYDPNTHNESIDFHYFNNQKDKRFGCLSQPNDKALNTALLTHEKYPDTDIILLHYTDPSQRFKLIKEDEQKFHNDAEIYNVAHIVNQMRSIYE